MYEQWREDRDFHCSVDREMQHCIFYITVAEQMLQLTLSWIFILAPPLTRTSTVWVWPPAAALITAVLPPCIVIKVEKQRIVVLHPHTNMHIDTVSYVSPLTDNYMHTHIPFLCHSPTPPKIPSPSLSIFTLPVFITHMYICPLSHWTRVGWSKRVQGAWGMVHVHVCTHLHLRCTCQDT